VRLKIDKSGRIILPKRLRERLGLKRLRKNLPEGRRNAGFQPAIPLDSTTAGNVPRYKSGWYTVDCGRQ
jgi:hypothetical protein